MDDLDSANLALLVLRCGLGAVMLAHGINHIFGGGKIAGTARWFASLGMKPGIVHAWLASLTEIAVARSLVLGLLTPLGGAAVIGVMLVAIVTNHRGNGFFIFRPGEGWEYVMTLTLAGFAIAILGAGEWSVDNALEIFDPPGTDGLLIALIAGGGGAAALLGGGLAPPPAEDRRVVEPLGPKLAEGRDSEIFEHGPRRVLRRAWDGRSLVEEGAVMRYVREQGYPLPEVFDAGDGWLVMERLEGTDMLSGIGKTPRGVMEAGRVLADLHQRLGAIPAPEWLSAGPGPGSTIDEDFPGIAALIDPTGAIVDRLPDWRPGTLVVDVPLDQEL